MFDFALFNDPVRSHLIDSDLFEYAVGYVRSKYNSEVLRSYTRSECQLDPGGMILVNGDKLSILIDGKMFVCNYEHIPSVFHTLTSHFRNEYYGEYLAARIYFRDYVLVIPESVRIELVKQIEPKASEGWKSLNDMYDRLRGHDNIIVPNLFPISSGGEA